MSLARTSSCRLELHQDARLCDGALEAEQQRPSRALRLDVQQLPAFAVRPSPALFVPRPLSRLRKMNGSERPPCDFANITMVHSRTDFACHGYHPDNVFPARIAQRGLVTLDASERLLRSPRSNGIGDARVTDPPVFRAADTPFVVRASDRVTILRAGDVHWIESAGNYVAVHASSGRLVARETMVHIAARLPSQLFVRIHRGAIVNVQQLVEIRRWRRGRLVVQLRCGIRLRVGRTYQKGLDRAVAQIAAAVR